MTKRIKPSSPARAKAATAAKPLTFSSSGTFPIVGIGASAGGLEALEQFLQHVPVDCGFGFVIIQHLDPTHKGIMVELLQRVTAMPVSQATDRQKVEPNHVYLIPPNKDMSILHGLLHLLAPVAAKGLRLPIDFFFRSLAEDRQDRSIGVILSGMGSDGTLGVRAIKEKAGAVFVQSLSSAKFDGMPRSVIDAGLADIVASAEELPDKIMAYLQHATVAVVKPDQPLEDKAQSGLDKIVILLRAQTGHDFSLYKRTTTYRRVERRMGLHQISRISDYVRFLRENPAEVELLFKELLIGVTSFFRDPAAWEQLKAEAIPPLLASHPRDKVLRAWTPGCSTGEEAYSLAMVYKEVLDSIKPPGNLALQIFATDLDQDAINRARLGVYPANIAADVSDERLRRFFVKDDRGYRVCKEIREMVVFAPQNLVMDPPFTKLDILSCRNLLIYLLPELQKKLIPLFHYSLNPGGLLFLGTAETIGNFTDLFSPLTGKMRIYRRLASHQRAEPIDFPSAFSPPSPEKAAAPSGEIKVPKPILNLQTVADHLLLQRYAPAAVLTSEKGDIVYISGRTGKYLEPAAGKANWNIFAMAREGLRYSLNEGLQQALQKMNAVVLKNIKVGTNGGTQFVDITVQPLDEPESVRGLMMFVFTDVAAPSEIKKTTGRSKRDSAGDGRLEQIEQELHQARAESQSLREEMQSSQEELRSTNEELQSTNEELQSTNEELTTSKEEMQSMNEELQTVNHELQSKVDELSWASNDMKNLLNSTNIATLFLDDALRVRRFTVQASQIIKLIPGDVGRPITDIATALIYPGLADDAHGVLQTLVFKETPVLSNDGRWFSVRIMPYRTQENKIDGVVVTFSDITAAKKLEEDLWKTSENLKSILRDISDAYLSVNTDLQITHLNPAAERMFARKMPELLARSLVDVLPEAYRPAIGQKCRQALSEKAPLTFQALFTDAPFRGPYEIRVYPQAEGLSILFQVSTQSDRIAHP